MYPMGNNFTYSTTLFSQQVMIPFIQSNCATENSILYLFFFAQNLKHILNNSHNKVQLLEK